MSNEIHTRPVSILRGRSEVSAFAWHPCNDLLAVGLNDSTARIWKFMDKKINLVLKHSFYYQCGLEVPSNVVNVLDWKCDGSVLATGSNDGVVRTWTFERPEPEPGFLTEHNGPIQGQCPCHPIQPIFALKWSKNGKYLLSGGADTTTIIWNESCKPEQQFAFHRKGVCHVDWKSDDSFASSAEDNLIHVCQLGHNRPVRTFVGHEDKINEIKWCPTGSLLASCSDDTTLKVWSMLQDNPVHNLQHHGAKVYDVSWSNTGPGTDNPNVNIMLASASSNTPVRLWDVERGEGLPTLDHKGNSKQVAAVSFSPNGRYLATGSCDKRVKIWSIPSGDLVMQCDTLGSILKLGWNSKGDNVAASISDGSAVVLHLPKRTQRVYPLRYTIDYDDPQ